MISDSVPIRMTGLEKRFGRGSGQRTVLQGITLSIRRGEVFGLFGNNGAGKSTLLRIIAGLLVPDGGECFVNGLDNEKDHLRIRREVGLCGADERSFYGRLTGRQNLHLFGQLYGVKPELAGEREESLLELFGLHKHAHRAVQTYSTGLRQRLNVARSLIHDPPILLLDEATKAADPSTSDRIRMLIRDHWARENKKTIIYVSQDLYGIESLCDRVAILENGKLFREGTIDEVLEGGFRDMRQLLHHIGQVSL